MKNTVNMRAGGAKLFTKSLQNHSLMDLLSSTAYACELNSLWDSNMLNIAISKDRNSGNFNARITAMIYEGNSGKENAD